MRFAAAILLIPTTTVWSGYVFQRLWLWFLVPALGAPSIGLAQAIGIDLLVSFAAKSWQGEPDDVPESYVKGALIPALALGIGAVVRMFL